MAGAMTLFNFSASFCNRLRLQQKTVDQLCESDSVRVLPALLAVYNTVKSRQKPRIETWLIKRLPEFSEEELRTIGREARTYLIKLLVSENPLLAEAALDAIEKNPASDCSPSLLMLAKKREEVLATVRIGKRARTLHHKIEQRTASGAEVLVRPSSFTDKGVALLRPAVTPHSNPTDPSRKRIPTPIRGSGGGGGFSPLSSLLTVSPYRKTIHLSFQI